MLLLGHEKDNHPQMTGFRATQNHSLLCILMHFTDVSDLKGMKCMFGFCTKIVTPQIIHVVGEWLNKHNKFIKIGLHLGQGI